MKTLFEQYAGYNVWANHKIILTIEQAEPEIWYQKTASSFDSLFKTVLHIWDAESAWWQRMRLHENIIVPSASFDASLKEACSGWLHQSIQWETMIKSVAFNDAVIKSNLAYSNFRGEPFNQTISQILLHVFNHSTYHRGQLVTMLHSVGVANIPATDFIVWSRTVAPISGASG